MMKVGGGLGVFGGTTPVIQMNTVKKCKYNDSNIYNMKYACIWLTCIIGRMIDAFIPIYKSISEKTYSIVKRLSGIFEPTTKLIDTDLHFEKTTTVLNDPLCDKRKIIVPGYMEHNPKIEAIKNK